VTKNYDLAAKVRIGPVHYLIVADRLASTGPVLSKRGVLKISLECSILYRLLLLIGAPFLRTRRCRNERDAVAKRSALNSTC